MILRKIVIAMGTALLVSVSGTAWPATPKLLELSKLPLFLSGVVSPNVFITLDDSASMRNAYIPSYLDSRQDAWLFLGQSSPVKRCGWQMPRMWSPDTNALYYNPDVTYEPPLRWDGTPFPPASFNAAWIDGISANTGQALNSSYVTDLSGNYLPTLELGKPRPTVSDQLSQYKVVKHNASFPRDTSDYGSCDSTKAEFKHPRVGVDGSGTSIYEPFYYRYVGPRNTDGTISTANQRSSANYRLCTLDDMAAPCITKPGAPANQRQNFANWYAYYRTSSLAMRSALTFVFAQRVAGVRMAWQVQEDQRDPRDIGPDAWITPGQTEMRDFDDVATKQDFFNFLFKFRLTGQTPTRRALLRVGEFVDNENTTAGYKDNRNPYWDGDAGMELSCRPNYHLIVTDGYWNEGPLPTSALSLQHDRTELASFPLPEGWKHSTYPAFSGGAYGPDGQTNSVTRRKEQAIFWFEDQDYLAERLANGALPSLADIAFHYWSTDLRPDLPNNAAPRWDDLSSGVTTSLPPPANGDEAMDHPEAFYNPANNPATHQHLVNFAISFGVGGRLAWPADLVRLRKAQVDWFYPEAESSANLDDLWHATMNSRGGYYSAASPTGLGDGLGQFLEVVQNRRGVSAAATVSSGVATSKTLAFKAGYDTTDWSGFVEAYRYKVDGTLQLPPVWRAQDVLTGGAPSAAERVIITSADADGRGIPFRWSSLPLDYKALLNDDPATFEADDDGLGESRVAFLRGDRSLEADEPGGVFRIRRNLLGAIAHASSVFVGPPASGYDDSRWPAGSPEREAATVPGGSYAAFVATHKNRKRQLIVGANDGMLHSFDAGTVTPDSAGTGVENWAYIPREVARNLSQLTRRGLTFEPFVDSSVAVRDVYLGTEKGWRTVLVGALRRGGQGFFALDVTNPKPGDGDAGAMVLWEFSDDVSGGQHIGFSYGVPNISRMHNGRWNAVISAGYNSHDPSLPPVGDGRAALYVVDMGSGKAVAELVVPEASGLGPATMGDYEGDGIDDFAVAGDLDGNLWFFDLKDSNPDNWGHFKLYEPSAPRPITSAPRIFGDAATGKAMVVFGTGKLLESDDSADLSPQGLYAVRLDGKAYPIVQDDLAMRQLDSFTQDGKEYFTVGGTAPTAEDRGWYLQLTRSGERIISTPGAHFSSGAVLVNSVIPNGGDPCRGGLRGNLYVLSASTGGTVVAQGIVPGVTSPDGDPVVGIGLDESAPGGTPPMVEKPGGGGAKLPDYEGVVIPTPTWRRRNHEVLQ